MRNRHQLTIKALCASLTSALILTCMSPAPPIVGEPSLAWSDPAPGQPDASTLASNPPKLYEVGVVLVKFKPTVSPAEVGGTLAARGLSLDRQVEGLGILAVRVPPGQEIAQTISLSQDARVEFAEPNGYYQATVNPDDPSLGSQWALAKIQAPAAWDVTTGSNTIAIGIVDTGVDRDHPDLDAKVVPGYDFANNDSDPTDDNGHGTHVAGIAAAETNNGVGIAGVSWGASIMPVKVLDASGSGTWEHVAAGIHYAADHGARIINLSLGGEYYSSSVQSAIDYAYDMGVLVFASAGNCGDPATYALNGCSTLNPILYPAGMNHVMGVAATDSSDHSASFSEHNGYVDVAAPGVLILSTLWNDTYASWSGTSMASPHVAGLAALVWSVNPALTSDDVANIIETTAVDLGDPGQDAHYGYGRINALAAVQEARCSTGVPCYTISGRVSDNAGDPLSGVTVSAGGTNSAVATAGGVYTVTGVITGTYILTPTANDYAFLPVTRSVSVPPNATGQDFTGQVRPPSLCEVLDNCDLLWTTGGDAPWIGKRAVFFYDGDAAQSGLLTSSSQISWLQATVSGPGIVSFYWKVSNSLATADLKLYVDSAQESCCPTYDQWQFQGLAIPSGDHIVKWVFSPLFSSGDEAGFVDKVEFKSGPAIVLLAPNGGETWQHRDLRSLRWASSDGVGPQVRLDLYKGSNVYYAITSTTANDGPYPWTVPVNLQPGIDYRVKITSTGAPDVNDISESAFTIMQSWQDLFRALLRLDGVDDYAEAADNPELDVGDSVGESLTIEAWMTEGTDPMGGELYVGKSHAYKLFLQRYVENPSLSEWGCIGVTLTSPIGQTGGLSPCQSPAFPLGWHHVAAVFSQATGQVQLYLDGVSQGAAYFGPAVNDSSGTLRIGGELGGMVDEVRISDVARYSGSGFDLSQVKVPFACDTYTRALWHLDEYQGAAIFHDACGTNDNVLSGYNGAHTEANPGVAIERVTISGSTNVALNDSYVFTAEVSPANASQPITYVWEPVPNSGQDTANPTYAWPVTGPQIISVTALNPGSQATVTHTVVVSSGVSFYSITGRVTLGGRGLPDVTVTATMSSTAVSEAPSSISGTASAMTDGNGNYTLAVSEASTYLLTFTKSGYRFEPVMVSVPADATQPVTAPDPTTKAGCYIPLILRWTAPTIADHSP